MDIEVRNVVQLLNVGSCFSNVSTFVCVCVCGVCGALVISACACVFTCVCVRVYVWCGG